MYNSTLRIEGRSTVDGCVWAENTKTPIATIVIRGATENLMDDIERAIDDGVNAYKALTKV